MDKVTLYGLDKSGSFKLWMIYTHENELYVEHGAEFNKDGSRGKLTLKPEFFNAGKQGRTPAEQAEFEAKSKIKKQMDKGYRATKEELTELPLLAMLASDFNKVGHRIKFKCYTSVKYDGVRCLVGYQEGVATLQSRTNQSYDVPHLKEQLEAFKKDHPHRYLDGEIYKHGYSLEDIISAVKRTDTQGEIDKCLRKCAKYRDDFESEESIEAHKELEHATMIHKLRPELEYHIFDVPSDKEFTDRLADLGDLFAASCQYEGIRITMYDIAEDEADMKRLHRLAVDDGFEGLMLRNFSGLYESGKRSGDLQKYKTFLDKEFLVLDIVPDSEDGCRFILQNDLKDNTFKAVMGDMAQRAMYLKFKSRYIDKWLNCQFQTRYKKTLKPQFATGKYFRDCNEFGEVLD